MKKKMMTVKSFLVFKEIKQEDFDTMEANEVAKIYSELQENNVEAFKELQEAGADKEELAKAVEAMNLEQSNKIEKILEAMAKGDEAQKQQGLAIAKLLKGGGAAVKTATLKSVVKDNFEAIKELSHNSGEVEIKTVFASTDITGNTDGTRDNSISELNTQYLTLKDIYPTENITGSNNYVYTDWDEGTVVRAAAMVAQGAAFPESTAAFVERNITTHKVGDSIPVNAEVWEDEARFGNELADFLRTNIAIKVQDELLNGDNTGIRLRGLIVSGTTYVPVAAALTDVNTWDVIRNVGLVMSKLGKKFRGSHVLLNDEEFYKMSSKKDGQNQYLTAPFVSADGTKVGSMKIIIDNSIADNQLIVLDDRYGKILQKVGIQIARGLVNNQFLTDQETLKVRERLNLLIKESNRPSVQVCTDIAAAKVAIAL